MPKNLVRTGLVASSNPLLTTVEKQAVTVSGSGDNLTVNNAKVICGG
jgi:hypothetical protein